MCARGGWVYPPPLFFFVLFGILFVVVFIFLLLFIYTSTRVCARVRGPAARGAGSHGHTGTGAQLRRSAADRGDAPRGVCVLRVRVPASGPFPQRYLVYSDGVSVGWGGWGAGRGSPVPAAGAAEPRARSPRQRVRGAQLCSAAAGGCRALPQPTRTGRPAGARTERGAFAGSTSPPLPGDSPGGGGCRAAGEAGGSTSSLTLPSNLGRRFAEHMTFC